MGKITDVKSVIEQFQNRHINVAKGAVTEYI